MYIRTSYGSIICIRLYGYNLSSLNGVAPLFGQSECLSVCKDIKKANEKQMFSKEKIFFLASLTPQRHPMPTAH